MIEITRPTPPPPPELPPFETLLVHCSTARRDTMEITRFDTYLAIALNDRTNGRTAYLHLSNNDVRELAEELLAHADYLES